NWMTWPELLMPYNKSVDIYTCPQKREWPYYGYAINVNSSNDDFPGAPTPPGNWHDGNGAGVPNPKQSTVSLASLQAPASTIWYYDSNPSVFQAGITDWANIESVSQANPGSALGEEIDGSEQIAVIILKAGAR